MSNEPYNSEERSLACEAAVYFQKENYESCCSSLKKLLSFRGHDLAVLSNKALAEYHRSNLTRTDEFRQQLKTATVACGMNLEGEESNNRQELIYVFYNLALTSYYQRQYHRSEQLLKRTSKLFTVCTDLSLRQKCLFLQLDTLLNLQYYDQVIQLCVRAEKQPNFYTNFGKGVDLDNQRSASKQMTHMPETQIFLSTLWLYKAKAYLMTDKGSSAQNCLKAIDDVGNKHSNWLLLMLQLHFMYVEKRYFQAIHFVKQVLPEHSDPSESGQIETVLHYNNLACMHFHVAKFNLGGFYLQCALKEDEKICEEYVQFNKNSASQKAASQTAKYHIPLRTYRMSKHFEILHNLGLHLLFAGKPTQAFDFILDVVNVFPRNPRTWLRLAECCIKTHRLANDVETKLEARKKVVVAAVGQGIFRKVALATGVAEVKKPWEEAAAMPTPTLEFGSLCIKNALLLLPRSPRELEPAFFAPMEDATDSLANRVGPAWLPDNLLKGMRLLSAEDARHRELLEWFSKQSIIVQPGGVLKGTEIVQLQNSLLACGSYISLCLNDFLGAIEMSRKLLRQPLVSPNHHYLARMYLSEALLSTTQAPYSTDTWKSLLIPEHIKSIAIASDASVTLVDNQQENIRLSQCYPHSVVQARGIMGYNLAASLAVKGEYDTARRVLSEASRILNSAGSGLETKSPDGSCDSILENYLPAQNYFLCIYLDLVQGRRQQAIRFIREHFGHMADIGLPSAEYMQQMSLSLQEINNSAAAASAASNQESSKEVAE